MTTDPEQFSTHKYKDTEWVSPEDETVLDGIDRTMDDHAEIDDRLEKVYESVPNYENPIKIEKNFELLYATLSDEDKNDFLLDLERVLYIEDESDAKKGAIRSFLDLHKGEITCND